MDNKYTIKALIMDVDGTLTDGGIYIGNYGEVMKKFNVKDGYAICHLLPEMNIIPIVITGRKSLIVENRCTELGIDMLVQGSTDKVSDMKAILTDLNIKLEQVAYIGDDVNDYDAMKLVKVTACPADAADEIKTIVDYITVFKGGEGAVRDFVEWIKKTSNYISNDIN